MRLGREAGSFGDVQMCSCRGEGLQIEMAAAGSRFFFGLSLSLLGLFLFLFSLLPLASVLGWILSQGVCVQGLLLKTGQTHFTGEGKMFTFSELSFGLLFNFLPSSGHP